MKIRDSVAQDVQNQSLELLNSQNRAQKKKKTSSDLLGEERVDLSTSQSISQALNPQTLEAERLARFEDIKRRVQNGTYKQPSSEELARSLLDSLNDEISQPTYRVENE